ncbi:hypothetical protein ACLB2K_060566 [Fragaria x ananassa]
MRGRDRTDCKHELMKTPSSLASESPDRSPSEKNMRKQSSIHGFFKRKSPEPEADVLASLPVSIEPEIPDIPHPKSARVDSNDDEISFASLERDPGRRRQI